MATRILIAGFQHETNTFAPSKAAYANFERGEGFPAMVRGDDVLALRDVNIPAGGFIAAAERRGWTLLAGDLGGRKPVGPCHRRRLRAHCRRDR
ncbi:M81 family metallopeptidase [Cupriavidus basilensis]